MVDRCTNKKNKQWIGYGGRKINVCKRWLNFYHFIEDMGIAPVDLTLERLNNNLGYFKSNCKWATKKEQANNRRGLVFIKHNGEKLTIAQWSDRTGIQHGTLLKRVQKGVPVKNIFSKTILRNSRVFSKLKLNTPISN